MANKCDELFQKMVEASNEYANWDARARLPLATEPLPNGAVVVYYTEQLRKQLDEAEANRNNAWGKYKTAIFAYGDCVKANR